MAENEAASGQDLKGRIDQTLQELRVVLPGTQALLGFQLVAIFSAQFPGLQASLKQLHLASLLLVCFSIMALMTPASFHRIALGGRDTPGFQRFASSMLLVAMALLAAGLAMDVFVIFRLVFAAAWVAPVVAGALLACLIACWFGLALAVKLASASASSESATSPFERRLKRRRSGA